MNAAERHAEGTVLNGKFRIVRLLGEGGMGAVYEIEHLLTHHRRALKLLHASVKGLPEVVQRFLREASAAGRIGNPHIVETFDAGELDSGEPYLVMELLAGEPLSKRISRKTRLDVPDLASILCQVAQAVHAAHQAGIIHRDLKPDNIFITDKDGKAFPKILDFGISKFAPGITEGLDSMTREGAMLGTPYYMAPEQLMGVKDVDARVDVWALGVILYECATGQKPFDADTLPQLALVVHQGQAVPIAQLRPDLPPQLVAIVEKAMTRDRASRMGTAQELAEALAPFASTAVAAASDPQKSPSPPAEKGTTLAMAATADPPSGMSASAPDGSQRKGARTGKASAGVWLGVVALSLVAAGVVAMSLRSRSPGVGPEGLPVNASAASATSVVPSANASASEPAMGSQPSTATPAPPSASAATMPDAGSGQPGSQTSKTKPVAAPPPTATAASTGKRATTKGLATENPIQ